MKREVRSHCFNIAIVCFKASCGTQLQNSDCRIHFVLFSGSIYLASTPGPTELVGPGSQPFILHGWGLGNAIAKKHHHAHKQLTVCWRSQELLLSMASSCQHVFQMLSSLQGDGPDSTR